MDQTGAKLLPFYLVVDVSYSMDGAKLDAANRILPQIVDALAQNPILSDKVRFGLIDFSDDARPGSPGDPLEPTSPCPRLTSGARPPTAPRSPCCVPRSSRTWPSSRPTSTWCTGRRCGSSATASRRTTKPPGGQAFADLTSSRMYPNFIPCGVDDADMNTMGSLIHPSSGPKPMAAYMMEPAFDPAKAITAMAEILISSMLASGYSLASGQSGTVLPDKSNLPAGINQYNPDDFV